jgi:nucleotide-binding universal stress UspA family protein
MENKSVLCCINGFKPSEAVIDYGSWLSKSSKTPLKLFYAIDKLHHETDADLSGSIGLGAREDLLEEFVKTEHEQNKLLQKQGLLILEAGEDQAKKNGVVQIDKCLRKGKVIENVLELKEKFSVAVMGKYGEKHQNTHDQSLVGHKVEAVVRALQKPILIVSEKFTEPKSLCLAFDGSEGAKKALGFILKNTCFHSMELHLVYVGVSSESIKFQLTEASELLDKASISNKTSFLEGEVAESLNEYIQKNDISFLTMGAFGHSWLRDMVMGSLTSKMISLIRKPVLLVR